MQYPRSDRTVTVCREVLPFHTEFTPPTDAVILYGIDETSAARMASWKDAGYRVWLMTSVTRGAYQDYLNGSFDGLQHQNELQSDRDGIPILHSPGIPYFVPTLSFVRYLISVCRNAVDLGADAIVLEEAEFWAKAGYSEAFRREWEIFYRENYRLPHQDARSQYKASVLKVHLLERCVEMLTSDLKTYARYTYGRDVKIYVAMHSLLGCAQSGILSVGSKLAEIPCIDGYIAQVWSGSTSAKNVLAGVRAERTFLTAYLEYAMMAQYTVDRKRDMFFMHSPAEGNVLNADKTERYLHSLTASLLQANVSQFEVCRYPASLFGQEKTGNKGMIPRELNGNTKTFLLTMMHLLRDIPDGGISEYDQIGLLFSDTAQYQYIYPDNDPYGLAFAGAIADYSSFYGLALPLMCVGVPLRPILAEQILRDSAVLLRYRVLVTSYEFWKPSSPSLHLLLKDWIESGGILFYVGDDNDSFHAMPAWWNTNGLEYASPTEHLIDRLGLATRVRAFRKKCARCGMLSCSVDESVFECGKGAFVFLNEHPAICADEPAYSGFLSKAFLHVAKKRGLPIEKKHVFALRRGPYRIAHVLGEGNNENYALKGVFVNLLDPALEVEKLFVASPGEDCLLYDLSKKLDNNFEIIAISAKILHYCDDGDCISFTASMPLRTDGVCRAYMPFEAVLTVDGKTVPFTRDETGQTVFFRFSCGDTYPEIRLIRSRT